MGQGHWYGQIVDGPYDALFANSTPCGEMDHVLYMFGNWLCPIIHSGPHGFHCLVS